MVTVNQWIQKLMYQHRHLLGTLQSLLGLGHGHTISVRTFVYFDGDSTIDSVRAWVGGGPSAAGVDVAANVNARHLSRAVVLPEVEAIVEQHKQGITVHLGYNTADSEVVQLMVERIKRDEVQGCENGCACMVAQYHSL